MALILFAVEHIVDEIHGARKHAENCERGDSADDGSDVGEVFGKHQGRKDEEVFRPLFRAQRDEETEENRRLGTR